MCPGPPFNRGHASSYLKKNNFLFTTPVSTLVQQGNEGHAQTPDFQVSGVNVVCMPVPREICHPSVVYSFIFCRLVAGGLMFFPVVSRVSLFEADDDTDDSQNDCTLRCVILLQLDLDLE